MGNANLNGATIKVKLNSDTTKTKSDASNTATEQSKGNENSPVQIELVMPNDNRNLQNNRKIGQDLTNVVGIPIVTFLSKRKSFTVFRNGNDYIMFRDYTFQTDNVTDIEFLREHEINGVEIFEGDYPEHVSNEMAERAKYLTKDKSEYEAS